MADGVRVGVVGLGLIGGSVALRLQAAGTEVITTDPDPGTRVAAGGARLRTEPDLGPWVAVCDLVVVCTPLDVLPDVLRRLAPVVAEHATVVDVGSVKRPVHALARAAGLGERFVGAHPMAGTEQSGYGHASPGLLDGATWAVTVEEGTTDLSRAAAVVRFVADELGGRVCVLAPGVHDEAAAAISHVPHVLAHLLLAGAQECSDPAVAGLLAAGSFRDGTRVAGTNPARTRNMLVENSEALVGELTRLRERLDDLTELLAHKDREGLLAVLTQVAGRAAQVRAPDPSLLASDEVEADTVLELLGAPGSHVVVSPARRG